MTNIKHKINIILLAAFIAAFFPINSARGTIASITVTPANPTTLSNGMSYYLAGVTYDFTVHVIDPDLTGWGQMGIVRITIPINTGTVDLQVIPSGTGAMAVTINSGTVNATSNVTGTFNDCTVTFSVTIRWDTEELLTPASKTITGYATTIYPASNTSSDPKTIIYGVCASMKILDLAASGVASDGMVNQWHDEFTITGTPVYNVNGATTSDYINNYSAGQIAGVGNVILYLNGVSTGIVTTTLPSLAFTVPALTLRTLGFLPGGAANIWRVRATMLTSGGPETSVNNLSIKCDEVEVTSVTFVNGGGINSPAYYRSTGIPGTEIVVNARMRYSGSTAMVGNTTLTINNVTDGTFFTVLIPHDSGSGTAIVPIPAAGGAPALYGYMQNYYQVSSISGGAYGGEVVDLINNVTLIPPPDGIPDNGQNVNTRINQPGAASIYWENGCYPYNFTNPAVFTTWIGSSATAYSITFNWTGIPVAFPNQDFSSYRVYYRKSGASAYQLIDKSTSGYPDLGTSTTATVTITGLIPLTLYEYYITAVDVFGNEVPYAQSLPLGAGGSIGTLASTITVTISDGITTYENNSFAVNPLPSARPLRKTAIKVKVFIVAAGDLPDIVNLLVANYTTGDFVSGGVLILTENDPAGYYRITTLKTGANEWTGFIPDTNPLMTIGTNIKFIIETIKGGVASYADNNSETENPLIPATVTPDDDPFTFAVTYQPTFTPWPTRVLNNVITDKNPRAYPAYYLTDDAYVTITVYDIKGRVVKTLLDKAYRSGGQNIKEDGWQGNNKSNRKVGVGLYYIHFKAERTTDGKVILDSFQKVVMSR